MKLLLVTINSRYTQSSLSLLYFAGILKQEFPDTSWNIHEFHLGLSAEECARDLLLQDPDLVCFSVYLWNTEFSCRIIDYLHKARPELSILCGGPEVSHCAEPFMKSHSGVNHVIRGEGEEPFRQFIRAFSSNSSLEGIPGLTTRVGNRVTSSPDSPPIANLGIIPSPLQLSLTDKCKKFIHYESSRGCPFSCSYCLSSLEKGVRYFPLDRVLRDMECFFASPHQMLRFVDRTFNLDPAHYRPIWEFLITNSPDDKHYQFEIDAGILVEDDLNLLDQSKRGLFQFEIGVQSISTDALRLCHRPDRLEEIRRNIRSLRKTGLFHLHLDLIAGLPGDDPQSFARAIDWVAECLPDTIQIGRLKVLNGTDMHDKARSLNLNFSSYPPYQIISGGCFSWRDILHFEELGRLAEIIYNCGRFEGFIKGVLKHLNLSAFLENLSNQWNAEGLPYHSLPLNSIFSALERWACGNQHSAWLIQLLIHDFLAGADFKTSPGTVFETPVNETDIRDFLLLEDCEPIRCRPYGRIRLVRYSMDFSDPVPADNCMLYIYHGKDKAFLRLSAQDADLIASGECLSTDSSQTLKQFVKSGMIKGRK
ncbi:MAG: DUF4080 domain-containing protein [Candidatus Wallbacteria bacterium]|nr:DUF4080 domain-containing protein [Candidatus Wallbacteria bacterium]